MDVAGEITSFHTRFDDLLAGGRDPSNMPEWRQLSRELLVTLVERQGTVITIQRQIIERLRINARDPELEILRLRADREFAIVQRLNALRRSIQATLAQLRPAFA